MYFTFNKTPALNTVFYGTQTFTINSKLVSATLKFLRLRTFQSYKH